MVGYFYCFYGGLMDTLELPKLNVIDWEREAQLWQDVTDEDGFPRFGGEYAPQRFVWEDGVFCWQPAVWANYQTESAGSHRRPHRAHRNAHVAKHRRK